MSFEEQLKKARLSRGMTPQQVADLMKIPNSTYCGYETGKRQPDVNKIKQLANILRTSGDVLLETGFAPEFEDKFYEARFVFTSLKPSFQDFAIDQIKKLAELQENDDG